MGTCSSCRIEDRLNMNSEWNELDGAAEANLNEQSLREFYRYKKRLYEEGYSWEDAEEILTGFIWDESEGA